MNEIIKYVGTQILAQIGTCTILCGAAIGLLISSGYLLVLSNEGRNKTFLIPLFIAFAVAIYFYVKNKKSCHEKGYSTTRDKLWGMTTFMLVSMLFTVLFMLYVFVPWWIPGYQGGALLP